MIRDIQMTSASMSGQLRRVLVIDPFVDEASMYAEYLEARGFVVTVYENPSEGLRAAALEPPGVVVTRLRQTDPALNGIDIVRRLKRSTATDAVPVVVITTSPLEQDRRAAEEAGCDAFLLLPVSPADLAGVIQTIG